MTLSEYLHDHSDDILTQWEARVGPPARPRSDSARRAHAAKLLRTLSFEMERRARFLAVEPELEGASAFRFWPTPASAAAAEYATMRDVVTSQWQAVRPTPSAEDMRDLRSFDVTLDDALAELLATIRPSRPDELFLGVLGHELRNAVSGITMAAHVLQRHESSATPSGRAGLRILKNCEGLRRTLDALQDYSQGALGAGLPLSKTDVDLGAVCHEAAAMFQATELRRRLRIEARGDLWGTWDRERVAQTVGALLINASRLAPSEAEISLIADGDAKDYVAISVHSMGNPIDAQSFREIFEPHQRVDTTRSTYAGLGLGLFVVREVVEAHAGRIDVDATEAGGTTVKIILPRA